MKTFFTLFLFLMTAGISFAQTIPNSDFENWNTVNLYEDPQGLTTSNLQAFILSQSPVVTKSTDKHSGSYAAKLETKIIGSDTIAGLITNGMFNNGGFGGGIPFTQRFDSLTFWAKYNLAAGDTAVLAVFAKYLGNTVGYALKRIGGSSNTYTKFSANMNWFVPAPAAPDSIIFLMVSSDPDGTPVNGSTITVDDIKLDNSLMPGGGFESWIMHSYEDPEHWQSLNFISAMFPPPYVTKTTDAYSGTYALKITTTLFNNNQDTLAHITNGRILINDLAGGMPTSYNPKKVSGYYKYTPVGFDSALVALRAYGYDIQGQHKNLTNNLIKLAPASSYTYFEIDLNYTAWPPIDTLGIAFASSNIYDGHQWARAGSVLIVDSLSIEYYPVGIAPSQKEKAMKVYPNPASTYVNFLLDNKTEKAHLTVYNSSGKIVINKTLTDEKTDVSNLSSGIYFYDILAGQKRYKGKFTVKH